MNPTSSGAPVPSSRITSLDGLRGVAILFVMVHHFGIHLPGWLDWGPVAPNVFFLLSGFLITGSLMRMRERPDKGGVLRFHVRRFARLLPAFYAMLAVGWFTGLSEFRDSWAWHVAFLTNVQMTLQSDWAGSASHLWSLSTQEQFYLLWPLILVVPARWMLTALLAAFAGAALFRVSCLQVGTTDFFRWFLLPGSLDAFAAGGIVAWIARTRKDGQILSPRWRWIFLAVLTGCWWWARVLRKEYGANGLSLALIDTLETLVFSGLLIELLQYRSSLLSRIFSHRPIRFLGRISYGLYLWHMLVVFSLTPLLGRFGWDVKTHPVLCFGILVSGSVAVAWFSWILLERPFLEMGDRMGVLLARNRCGSVAVFRSLAGFSRI